MNKTIVSFGDSFIFGSELDNNDDGSQAWPGLIARELNCNYKTLAIAGCGNENIARQIYTYFADNTADLVIVNWTWISRWDFHIPHNDNDETDIHNLVEYVSRDEYNLIAGADWPAYNRFVERDKGSTPSIQQEVKQYINNLKDKILAHWITLGYTCAPEKLNWLHANANADKIIDFYTNFIGDNTLWSKFRNLQTIYAAQTFLKSLNIKSIQTYMDYDLLDDSHEKLSPMYIQQLQNQIRLELFDNNQNFLDWAHNKKFAVTPAPKSHPLQEAHTAAAKMWIDRYRELLNE
jgi:hypothetical protein